MKSSIGRLDLVCWTMVILFFCSSAVIFDGDFKNSFMASAGVVLVMILIGLSIEVLIETLSSLKGIGTITGFITNGPELVCLIVGLFMGDVLFAASTPLGSNFINPVLLVAASVICRVFSKTMNVNLRYSLTCIFSTAALAVSFYFLPSQFRIGWIAAAGIISVLLFLIRPHEEAADSDENETINLWYMVPATLVLISAGYFLDPVVSFASLQSHAPKGIIGFFVLATLSSWPEFKCCLGLLHRKKYLAAILNITVSNITNIWLAVSGVAAYHFLT